VRRTGIYLRENGEFVGPFQSRGDAERFLELMELFGESAEGIEIVEISDAAAPFRDVVTPEERRRLLDTAERRQQSRNKADAEGGLSPRALGRQRKTDPERRN
jgi:hypothetical protein